jgi:diacylglycerol kinase (ATP)
MKNLFMIYNPHGGLKKGKSILKKIKPLFALAKIELTILETEYSGHAYDFAKTLSFNQHDGICVIGGDGTMHEIINGMLNREDNKKIPIGLITGGTGNSFMHDMNCLDPIKAAKKIIAGKIRAIDLAKVDADGEIFYSFNLVGWGVPTDSNILAEKLRWFGGLRYNISAVIEVLKGKKRISKLICDGEEYEDDFIFIIGCNTIHVGKGMKMAPKAKVDDGKIDLIIVRKVNRFRILLLFPKLFNGTHIESPFVEYKQVKEFSIIPKIKNGLNIDGEMKGFTPTHVKMKTKKISVYN